MLRIKWHYDYDHINDTIKGTLVQVWLVFIREGRPGSRGRTQGRAYPGGDMAGGSGGTASRSAHACSSGGPGSTATL